MTRSAEPLALLEAACGSAFPGAVTWVDHAGTVALDAAVGLAAVEPAARPATPALFYDLASLTKPISTTTLLCEAILSGALSLDTPVAKLLPGAHASWRTVTVRHLAGHTSGLPAFRALDPERPREDLLGTPLEAPPGERAVYSDFGYIALGWVIEAALGGDLSVLLQQAASHHPLGALGYRSISKGSALEPDIAPTERAVPPGVVHDPNARLLGGVAGHAGLFGTAADVGRWARHLLRHWFEKTPLGSLLTTLWHAPSIATRPTTWRLGFDTVTPGGSSAGRWLGPRAVGHLGYTGTSVWIDPDLDLVIVLLSNRVHPIDEAEPRIRAVRPAFHDAVVASLGLAGDASGRLRTASRSRSTG